MIQTGLLLIAIISPFLTVNLTRIVPDGLLVFFPSYYLLEQSIECWKSLVSPNQKLNMYALG